MAINENIHRDAEVFKQRLAGATYKTIADANGISVERARQVYKTISRRCYHHVIVGNLEKPDNWEQYEYGGNLTGNKEYWLGVLEDYVKLQDRKMNPSPNHPIADLAINKRISHKLIELGITTIGELWTATVYRPAGVLSAFTDTIGTDAPIDDLQLLIKKHLSRGNDK